MLSALFCYPGKCLCVSIWHIWFTSVKPALKRLRLEDGYKVKASLGYNRKSKLNMRPSLKDLETECQRLCQTDTKGVGGLNLIGGESNP